MAVLSKQLINKLGNYLLKSINETVNDVTNVLYLMYGDMYKCTNLSKSIWYELREGKWYEIEHGINLRKKISKELALEYIRFRQFCVQMAESSMDDELPDNLEYDIDGFDFTENISDERWFKMISLCDEIVIQLKSTNYKDSIMKKAEEIFYSRNFKKQLHKKLHKQNKRLQIKNKRLKEKLQNSSIKNENIHIENISEYSITLKNNSLILEFNDNEY